VLGSKVADCGKSSASIALARLAVSSAHRVQAGHAQKFGILRETPRLGDFDWIDRKVNAVKS